MNVLIKCHILYPVKMLKFCFPFKSMVPYMTVCFVLNLKGFNGISCLRIMFFKYETEFLIRKFIRQKEKIKTEHVIPDD